MSSAVPPAGGASAMNSTRPPGGTPMWSAQATSGVPRPRALTGTPSIATTPSGCAAACTSSARCR